MLYNENTEGEDLGQEKKGFWFCSLAILHTVLAED
jgi:hypothetical protein